MKLFQFLNTVTGRKGAMALSLGRVIGHKLILDTTDTISFTGVYPPFDETIPQRSEVGNLDAVVNYTPISATSELWVHFFGVCGCSSTGGTPAIFVFIDGSDDCVAVFPSNSMGNTNYVGGLKGSARIAHPGVGVARAVELRFGMTIANATIVIRLNGSSGYTDLYGSAPRSCAWIEEMEPTA